MTESLLPFLGFAVAATATPGPNNLLVLATAARHGLRAALPILGGIALGFGFMVAAVGIGLAAPLAAYAGLHAALRWAGAAWMLLLAWRIARADPVLAPAGAAAAPMGFLGAAAFQWVNPKAWVMALAATATYTAPGGAVAARVLLLAAIFTLVSLPCVGAWALLGAGARSWLVSPARMRAFNRAMGLLLAASVLPVILG